MLYFILLNNNAYRHQEMLQKVAKEKKQKFYIVNIQTNKGVKKVPVSKKEYDKVRDNDKVTYKNGKIKINK